MGDVLDQLRTALAGRYTIERELGRGGNAVVYLADDVKHGRKVAIKVLLPELALAVRAERFLREVQISARLTHPHILGLHDSGEIGGMLYYVMPYVEGESLRARITRERHLSVEDALRITREVAGALGYAHRQGIVHRDIKPENILLSPGGAIVADFGIARALDAASDQQVTESGIAVGTPAYMSPEQGSGSQAVDARSDIYALGCVLYEMLVGRPPYTGATAQEVLGRHTLDPVPTVRAVRPAVSDQLQATITKALAKHPADRFASVHDFASALDDSPSTPPVRRGRVLAAASVVVLLAVIVWGVLQSGAAPNSVAVLPCENLSTDPAAEYFSDGMTEDLINKLLRVSGLQVPGYASSMRFKGQDDLVAVGEGLDVANLLDCKVRRAGSQMRVSVQLIDASSGRGLWGETYASELRSAADVYAPQDSIAQAVAAQLQVSLTGADTLALAQTSTRSLEADSLYKLGRVEWWKRTRDPVLKSIEYFQRALLADSTYALAWSGLAEAYVQAGEEVFMPRADAVPKAEAAALKAVEFGDHLAEAHVALAKSWHQFGGKNDFAGAEGEYLKAFDLNPRYAPAHSAYGLMLGRDWRERFDVAIRETKLAVELDPLNGPFNRYAGMTLYGSGQPREAMPYTRKAIELAPQWANPYGDLAAELSDLGDHEEALKNYREAVRLNSTAPGLRWNVGDELVALGRFKEAIDVFEEGRKLPQGNSLVWRGRGGRAYALAGDTAKARAILGELNETAKTGAVWGMIALVQIGLGEKDRAIEALTQGEASGGAGSTVITTRKYWGPIRNDKRFQALLRKRGLNS